MNPAFWGWDSAGSGDSVAFWGWGGNVDVVTTATPLSLIGSGSSYIQTIITVSEY